MPQGGTAQQNTGVNYQDQKQKSEQNEQGEIPQTKKDKRKFETLLILKSVFLPDAGLK